VHLAAVGQLDQRHRAGEVDGGTKVDAQALGPQRAPELDSDAEEAAPVDRVAGRGSLDHSIRHQAGLA
jgi:hypothetical protein